MSGHDDGQSLAVAVSGGMDSLALLFLLARHRRARRCGGGHKGGIFALSVDHGLRPEAQQEARHAGRIARRLGVPHIILRNRREIAPCQEAARNVRFELLASWCRRNGVKYCALGHHQADQAETFLFRLARGSGMDGLAAMAERRIYDGCHFIRPILGVKRSRLEAVLREAGIAWREDASNFSPAYSRTHLGQALRVLADRGLTPERLARAASGAACIRGILSQAAADFLRDHAELAAGGYYWLSRAPFYALSRPVADRVLGHILRRIGGRVFNPSQAKLDRFYDGLHDDLGAQRTLAGCRVIIRKTRFLIFREFADIGAPLRLRRGGEGIWDRRFHVRVNRSCGGGGGAGGAFEIASLGRGAPAALMEGFSPDMAKGIPKIIWPCLPALWRAGSVVCVPHLGFHRGRLAVFSL